jgi:predicted type IV restriction endonuclease
MPFIAALGYNVFDPSEVTPELDDNNRKPICRLHFNGSKKYIGFFDGQREGQSSLKEERILLEHIDDIYHLAERLKGTVMRYEAKPLASKAATNGVG